jgi:hypothetical protein
MDQLLKSLNDLHQAASSVCLHLQQLPANLTQGRSSNNTASSASLLALGCTRSSSHSRACSQKGGRRVHFTPSFAAINNTFVVQGSGTGGQAGGKGGRSNGKGSSSSKQEEEDEERILISEVCMYMLLHSCPLRSSCDCLLLACSVLCVTRQL